jgi:hypothetical protein
VGLQEAFAAEAAAVRSYAESRRGGPRYVLGIDVSKYVGYKTPGIDITKLFSDPCCILKDAETRRKSGKMYLWKKPDDAYTKSMVARQVLRPVLADEIDPASPYANVDLVRIITREGPRQVVRTPAGLGLFETADTETLNELDRGLLPGKQWEGKYLSDLADHGDQFGADMESLSNASMGGRVHGELTSKDTQAEPIL